MEIVNGTEKIRQVTKILISEYLLKVGLFQTFRIFFISFLPVVSLGWALPA